MPLPAVHGWMIDYRTAHAVFASKSNKRISHCVTLCQKGTIYICHHEEDWFQDDELLKATFLVDQCRIYEPDEDIFNRCPAIETTGCGKPLLAGSEAAVFITATALAKGFGVISDYLSPRFATVRDLCSVFGVPVLTSDEYFSKV